MRFKASKVYGNSKELTCPFCGKIATQKNTQGLDVCRIHTKENLEDIRCSCGSWLETRAGKFGPYFLCMKCGIIPYKKGMELKEMMPITSTVEKEPTPQLKEKKEITISTNDVEYFS